MLLPFSDELASITVKIFNDFFSLHYKLKDKV